MVVKVTCNHSSKGLRGKSFNNYYYFYLEIESGKMGYNQPFLYEIDS